MKGTKQQRINHLLWLLMRTDIHSYLSLCNKNKTSSTLIVYHTNLCQNFLASTFLCDPGEVVTINSQAFSPIHSATKRLTDSLEREIGSPPKQIKADLDSLSREFFIQYLAIAYKAISEQETSAHIEDSTIPEDAIPEIIHANSPDSHVTLNAPT